MLEFLTKFFRREEASKNLAKERLRLVLMSDRVSLAPDIFDTMKIEMLDVIRRYLDVDERALDMHFENADRQFMLLANIPVLKVKAYKKPAPWREPLADAGRNGNGASGLVQSTASADVSPPRAPVNFDLGLSAPAAAPAEDLPPAVSKSATPSAKRRRRRRKKVASAAAAQESAPPDGSLETAAPAPPAASDETRQ